MRINQPDKVALRRGRIEQLLRAKYPGVWPGLVQKATADYDGAVRDVATSILGPLSGRILSGEFGDPFEGEDDDIDLLSDAEGENATATPISDAAIRAAQALVDQLLSDHRKLETVPDTEIEQQVAALLLTGGGDEPENANDGSEEDDTKVDQRYLKTLLIVLRACLIDGYGYRDDGAPDSAASNLEVRRLVYDATRAGRPKRYEGDDGKRDSDRRYRAISRAITDAMLKGRQ